MMKCLQKQWIRFIRTTSSSHIKQFDTLRRWPCLTIAVILGYGQCSEFPGHYNTKFWNSLPLSDQIFKNKSGKNLFTNTFAHSILTQTIQIKHNDSMASFSHYYCIRRAMFPTSTRNTSISRCCWLEHWASFGSTY